MNRTIRKSLCFAATLIWMALIFWFSAQPADTSGEMSMGAGRFIGRLVVRDYQNLSAKNQDDFAKKIEYGVRKTAHAAEYAVLGILIWQIFLAYEKKERRYMISCVLVGAAYAATDEFHQLFVPGRSGRFTDVMIDTCGIIAGVLLSYEIRRILQKKEIGLWKSSAQNGEKN